EINNTFLTSQESSTDEISNVKNETLPIITNKQNLESFIQDITIKEADLAWCSYCTGSMKLTLKDVKQITLSRYGQCLLTDDTWCPFCYKYKYEQLCQKIVTKYLDPPFENRRPKFLKTPEHQNGLELDIPYYNYSFAIEVQEEQHEKYIKFFHRRDPTNFIKQQVQDQLKKEL
ncbi:4840_t:CDS:2, partial [Cetraspora pellucida]